MRILLVEDDRSLGRLLDQRLTKTGYAVDRVIDGADVEDRLAQNTYDLIILDVNLPNKDGFTICKEARAAGCNTPILMLTQRGAPSDRVAGLDAGADDYLPKPFSAEEMEARIRAILRRPSTTLPDVLTVNDLKVDVISHTVRRGESSINLMPKEFSLLEFLMRRAGEVVSKGELLTHVWGIYSHTSSNRLEVYIRYLREKIDEPFDTKLIQTVRGKGYKIAG